MKRMLIAMVSAAFFGAMLVACGGSDTKNEARAGQGGADTDAALTITSPKMNENVDSGKITVKVDVDNFRIVDKIGQTASPGQGHYIYYYDIDNVPTAAGQSALLGAGSYETTDDSHTWDNVTPGPHKLSVQLVNSDRTPLNPPVVATVSVVAR